MISQADFKNSMKDVCLLIGQLNPPKEQLMIFYDKLKGFDLKDFELACKDDEMLAELTNRRVLNFIVIKNTVMRYQLARQAKEEEAEARRRKKEEAEILKNNDLPEEVIAFIKSLKKM